MFKTQMRPITTEIDPNRSGPLTLYPGTVEIPRDLLVPVMGIDLPFSEDMRWIHLNPDQQEKNVPPPEDTENVRKLADWVVKTCMLPDEAREDASGPPIDLAFLGRTRSRGHATEERPVSLFSGYHIAVVALRGSLIIGENRVGLPRTTEVAAGTVVRANGWNQLLPDITAQKNELPHKYLILGQRAKYPHKLL